MAIVTMKRLRLIALRSDREKLIRQLQRAGCVEISQPQVSEDDPTQAILTRPPGDSLAAARERQSRGELALRLLKQYGEKQKGLQPRPTVSEARFFDETAYTGAQAMVDRLWEINKELASLSSERSKLSAQRASLAPWLELEVPLETVSTPGMTASFGSFPASADVESLMAELAAVTDLWDILPAGKDSSFRYLFFACHRSVEEETGEILQRYGFSRTTFRGLTGTAAENDARLAHELEKHDERAARLRAEIHDMSPSLPDVRLYVDWVAQEVQREEGKARLMDTGETFYLTGWFPASEEGKLQELIGSYTCAWETEEPAEEEYPQVPVRLKNNWFTGPLSMVTEMYSLPAYGSVDPNPLMAPFFVLFYGMMMADMGYGLVMMAISVYAVKKLKPKGPTMRHMMPLLGLCGVSTFLWGAVTGGFFGDMLPQLASIIDPNTTFTKMPALFSPLDDALMVLIGSLVLGVIQIFTGMAVSMYRQIKRGEVMAALCNEGAWYLVFLLAGGGIALGQAKWGLIGALAVIVLTQGYGKKGIGGKLMGIGGSLYNNITGYFSDILSYSRLMALMLAGAVIAQVFNTLGAITGNVVFFFVISMFGNALNFALNILGCFVHGMRLQCLEFFGRFYEDGGKPFTPLEINPKYVDITNK